MVASLVREAIDARYGPIGGAERAKAVERIAAISGGTFLTPAQLNRATEEAREATTPS
jgi:hypothetical protein